MDQKQNVSAPPRVQEIPVNATVEETAFILRFRSPIKIYELLEAGRLRSVVIDGRRTITGESIAELLQASQQHTYAPTRESPKARAKREKAAA